MALILNIDTATEHASVCISNDAEILAMEKNANLKDHASFLQPAIKQIMCAADYPLSKIDAVAVTAGPGSYTGLRVGLSSAKGLCYALNKPLILINTLEVMAFASIQEFQKDLSEEENKTPQTNFLFCPMIDARRMEVFTALYNANAEIVAAPAAEILNALSFAEQLKENKIIFSGSGSSKFQSIITDANAVFSAVQYDSGHLSSLSLRAFHAGKFADLAYAEPFYLKEFFTTAKKI